MKITFKTNAAAPSSVPSLVQKALTVLDKMPDGEAIDTRGLASIIGRAQSTLDYHTTDPLLLPFRHVVSRRCWWGNQRTIAELRKKFP